MDQPSTPSATPSSAQGAKNFFLFFVAFVLLYLVSYNLGNVLWQIINKSMPQLGIDGSVSYFRPQALRFGLAALIIGSPVFLWLSTVIHRNTVRDTTVRHSGIRRWLTYITLAVAALIIIGDLIGLVYNLLGGELSGRFIMKAVVILVIAAAVFFYYLMDMRLMRDNAAPAGMFYRSFMIGVIAVITCTVVTGFFFIENPMQQRLRKEDGVRMERLRNIENAVYNSWQVNQSLPSSLETLVLGEGVTVDPISNTPFEYQITSTTTFSLCATFSTSNRDQQAAAEYGGYLSPDELHDAGRTCFTRRVNDFTNNAPMKIPTQ